LINPWHKIKLAKVKYPDIFKDYEITSLNAVDAKFICLSAVITEVKAGVENFVV
jgi:hypothetical protein